MQKQPLDAGRGMAEVERPYLRADFRQRVVDVRKRSKERVSVRDPDPVSLTEILSRVLVTDH